MTLLDKSPATRARKPDSARQPEIDLATSRRGTPGGPVESEAQLAATSRSRRLMSSMAAQLTGGKKVPDEGWP